MKQKKYEKVLRLTCMSRNTVDELLRIMSEDCITGVTVFLKAMPKKNGSIKVILVTAGKDQTAVNIMHGTLFAGYIRKETLI